jgi:hypothetical protein
MNSLFQTLIKNFRYSFVGIFLVTSFATHAQSSSTISNGIAIDTQRELPTKIISFGEKINLGKMEQSIVWTISSIDLGLQLDLKGNEINNYIFEKPGTYQITFVGSNHSNEEECNHVSFPELLVVKVSPIKMIFDFDSVQFQNSIESQVANVNTTVSLNVYFKSYTNTPILFSNGKVVSAGVGTTIQGQLLQPTTLNLGNNRLVYQLEGSATKDTYIMFDFFDMNEQVQSYYYPTKL